MLGELHGENEIPALVRSLWPSMWKTGYRYIAAEISPWAANRLEFGGNAPISGLWTQPEATFVASLKRDRAAVLWGCDIEEAQPHFLIRELAAENTRSKDLQAAAEMVKRPMRQPLHRLPANKRSAIEASLVYWADSYDAIIFYREVTPL